MGAVSTAVETLRPGEMMRCGVAEARVKSVRTLQPRVRHLVTITYAAADDLEGFLTLTDDHALQVRRGCRVVRPALAADVGEGDFVLVPNGEAKVLSVEHLFENTAVVEVAFEKEDQVAFVSTEGSPLPVAVYGSCAMHMVKILQFKRYDGFRELFFDSADLAPCRNALRTVGFSMDLSELNLGQGKLVVSDVELARQVLDAIRLRQIQGKILRKSDVVVSADMEGIVRSLVMANPATMKKNQHVNNEPGELLDLSHLYRGRKRQYLESRQVGERVHSVNWVPAPRSDITCAATTTDANRPSLSRARTNQRHLAQF
jgi:hypothetical protein